MDPILEVLDLTTYFYTPLGVARAVDGISYSLQGGESLGIVGESGSGKSVSALSLLRLVESPPGRIVRGRVLFRGEDLLQSPRERIRQIRGRHVSMIFQEPMTSLNPCYTVGDQIGEVLRIHTQISRHEARQRTVELLDQVHIPDPNRAVKQYPHELSGGMRQRVMIAMALACKPDILIADEPTTALDVTIQAQILALLARLKEDLGMATIFITHDLGIIAQYVSRVLVMYAGRIVESAATTDLFLNPRHPYTLGLLHSLPRLGARSKGERKRLAEIPGVVPSLYNLPPGCRFANRCERSADRCRREEPALVAVAEGHEVACWLAEDHPYAD
ncbi:MAG: ABC transporter ATP-binding protein [Deltaproteobacteria bacterium]|nr:ABC transporter ATP-binding protein [Deltaproteobacteria bacterium]MBW2120422.1 ABC transporter ATP-binding protein [Deltaproteobacteria bacterium]